VCTERAQERELERKRGGKGRKGEKERDKDIYIYWVLTKKVAKKIRLYVAQET